MLGRGPAHCDAPPASPSLIPAGLLSWSTWGRRNWLPQGTDLAALGEIQAMLTHMLLRGDQGRATGCPSTAEWWLPLLTCNCCPAPNELDKKSGFGRWAQHQVKLLVVPFQGEVEAECGAALVHPNVML